MASLIDYRCMGLDPVGLGWVMGPKVHLAVGCVGLGQLFGGLPSYHSGNLSTKGSFVHTRCSRPTRS